MKPIIKTATKHLIVAGKHKVINKGGFLFERLQLEGDTVEVSKEFLAKHKETTGRDFTSSWLKLVEEVQISKPAVKPSK